MNSMSRVDVTGCLIPRDVARAQSRRARASGQVSWKSVQPREGEIFARGRWVLSVMSEKLFEAQALFTRTLSLRCPDDESTYQEMLIAGGFNLEHAKLIVDSEVMAFFEARDILVELGFANRQIRNLERTRKPSYVVPILSPCDAIITNALPPGTEFKNGEELFWFSRVESYYVSTSLIGQLAQKLSIGSRAQMWALKRPEKKYSAVVDGIGMLGMPAGVWPIQHDLPTPLFLTIAHGQPKLSLSDEVCVRFRFLEPKD